MTKPDAQISSLAYEREYELWTVPEYSDLLDDLRGDLSIEMIGARMQRTPSALHSRVKCFSPDMKGPVGRVGDDWLPEVRAHLRGESREHWLATLRQNYQTLGRDLPEM